MIRSSIRAFVLPLVALAGLVTATEDTCGGPNARIEPPLGAIVVNSTGDYDGSYLTVSEGVESLDVATTEKQTIFVMLGVYKEQMRVPVLAGALVLQGSTCDAMSYEDNEAQ
ncbi:hypothetical protein PR002_g21328 [Phytophthora rubi]|uniref:Pectinesterase n=1 Tax=Phytophthora rubi TaxID=129364 RepID=A0A6A3J8T4_9STRA|nr:hypothetical protein PR002_g21328 [Phytophthora rubi]